MWRFLKLVSSLMLCFGLTGAVSVASQRKPLMVYPCLFIDGWQVRLDTKQWEPVSARTLAYAFAAPSWRVAHLVSSPDGSRAAFVVVYSLNDVTEPADLLIVDSRTRTFTFVERNLPNTHGPHFQLAWSPDGAMLAYTLLDKQGLHHLAVSSADMRSQRRVTIPPNVLLEGWTSAGTVIISADMDYTQPTTSLNIGERLYIFSAPTLSLQGIVELGAMSSLLHPGRRENYSVWFLNNGSQIAYFVVGIPSQTTFVIADAFGNTLYTYLIPISVDFPTIIESPNGRFIAVANFPLTPDVSAFRTVPSAGRLDVIDLVRGTIKNISTHIHHWRMYSPFDVQWAADGESLLYVEGSRPQQFEFMRYYVPTGTYQQLLPTLERDVLYGQDRTHAVFFAAGPLQTTLAGIVDLSGRSAPFTVLDRVQWSLHSFQWLSGDKKGILSSLTYDPIFYHGRTPSLIVVVSPLDRHQERYAYQGVVKPPLVQSTNGTFVATPFLKGDGYGQPNARRAQSLILLDYVTQRSVYLKTPFDSNDHVTVRSWSPDDGSILVWGSDQYAVIRLDGSIAKLGTPPTIDDKATITWGRCNHTARIMS